MNLDNINPFKQTRFKIKVFGERNTATVYLEWLLRNNLKVNLLDYYTLGWKHRLAPGKDEIQPVEDNSILFLCLVKNPYSWLLSMYRKPYGQEKLKELNFSEFLRFPYGDYRNPIVMWNIKNQSFLNLKEEVKYHGLIRYEDLLKDPQTSLELLSSKFGLNKTRHWFINLDKYITNHHGITDNPFHKDYYIQEKWRNEYSVEDIQFIKNQLDVELTKKLHYEIISWLNIFRKS